MTLPGDGGKPLAFAASGAFTEQPARRQNTAIAEGEPARSPFCSSADYALLQITRDTRGGLLVSFTVELDGCVVGGLSFRAPLDLEISPGEHVLGISGGGAFSAAQERFFVRPTELVAYTVCYSWYGGVKLSRVIY
jgi:hypothetical protein